GARVKPQCKLQIAPLPPQGHLIEHRRATEPSILPTQNDKVIRIKIREIGNMTCGGNQVDKVPPISERTRGLHHGCTSSRDGRITKLQPPTHPRHHRKKMCEAPAVPSAPISGRCKSPDSCAHRLSQGPYNLRP